MIGVGTLTNAGTISPQNNAVPRPVYHRRQLRRITGVNAAPSSTQTGCADRVAIAAARSLQLKHFQSDG
jgi:hypothetical protein